MRKKAKNSKTVELVRSTYQPTKAEKCDEFQTDASVEQMADALLRPVNVRWLDKPRNRRAR